MSYLMLLFSVALAGAALAALGPQWQAQAQREREAELLFRGLQIRNALQAWQANTAPGQAGLPERLEDLLDDPRPGSSGTGPARYWLRQLYTDPFTGAADWVLLRTPDGGIRGVHSRSRTPAMRQHALPLTVARSSGPNHNGVVTDAPAAVGDWRFEIEVRPMPVTTAPRRKP